MWRSGLGIEKNRNEEDDNGSHTQLRGERVAPWA